MMSRFSKKVTVIYRVAAGMAFAIIRAFCFEAEAGEDRVLLRHARTLGDSSWRHSSTINHIDLLPDGKRVLSASNDSTARIWDTATGKELQRFVDPEGSLWFALLLKDEKHVATAGNDGNIRIFDIESGEILRTLKHPRTVFRLAQSPDGKYLAGSDRANNAIVWNLADGSEHRRFSERTDEGVYGVYTVAFSRDGKRLLTGGDDNILRFWGMEHGTMDFAHDPGLGDLFTLRPAPGGDRFAASYAKGVQVMDDRGALLSTLNLGQNVHTFGWAPDGKSLVLSSGNGLQWYDIETGGVFRTIELPGSTRRGVALSHDGKEIFCGIENIIARFRADDGKRLSPAPDQEILLLGAIHGLVQSVAGKPIFHYNGKGVYKWEPDGQVSAHWLTTENVQDLGISPDGNTLLVAGGEWDSGWVRLLDARDGRVRQSLNADQRIYSAAITSDATRVLAVDSESLYVWRLHDSRLLLKTEDIMPNAQSLDICPADLMAAIRCSDGILQLRSIEDGKSIAILNVPGEELHECFFSDIGGLALFAASTKKVFRWPMSGTGEAELQDEDVAMLVKQLGADEFRERRAATRSLIHAGRPVLPKIQDVQSDDPEVRVRLEQIRQQITNASQFEKYETMIDLGQEAEITAMTASATGKYFVVAFTNGPKAWIELYINGPERTWQRVQSLPIDDHASALTVNADGALVVGLRCSTIVMFDPVPQAAE